MEAVKKLGEIFRNRHDYARDWKARKRGDVVGCFCIYVPEEIIYAAGMLPVRILGSREPEDVTEPYITGWFCPHCRDCLAQVLKGRYKYVDGIVYANSCSHIYQTFVSWHWNMPPSYAYTFYMPNLLSSPFSHEFVQQEYKLFKQSLEAWKTFPIGDDDLSQSIQVYNENRQLLKQVYELRKGARPPITGTQALEITLSSAIMDKAEHSQLLRQALEEMKQVDKSPEPEARLMLLGSEMDDVDMVRFIESMGSTVVTDDLCTGSRYFWGDPISLNGDLLGAVARRYTERPSCPHKDIVVRRRIPHILKLAEEHQVQGVVYLLEKFCEPHGFDLPLIQRLFKEKGIPLLLLETDMTTPYGQFRTRVEAFLDQIRGL